MLTAWNIRASKWEDLEKAPRECNFVGSFGPKPGSSPGDTSNLLSSFVWCNQGNYLYAYSVNELHFFQLRQSLTSSYFPHFSSCSTFSSQFLFFISEAAYGSTHCWNNLRKCNGAYHLLVFLVCDTVLSWTKWNALLPYFLRDESFLGVLPGNSQFNNKSICLYVICNIRIFVLIFYFMVVPHAGRGYDTGYPTRWGERMQTMGVLITKITEDGFFDNNNHNSILLYMYIISHLLWCLTFMTTLWGHWEGYIVCLIYASGNWRMLSFEWVFCLWWAVMPHM